MEEQGPSEAQVQAAVQAFLADGWKLDVQELTDTMRKALVAAAGVPAVDRSQFGKQGSQPALVEAVLQSGVEFATVCERIGEGRGGERAPYRDAFYDAVARLAAAAGVEGRRK
jgi:5-formyltetrahydrofolate cyclo-ligase